MIDTFHITDNSQANQVFFCTGSGTTAAWQTWSKPSNCNYVHMILIGGGAGGQGGEIGTGGAGGVTRDGGYGGGSSSITYITYPSFVLPDVLYIKVGQGGKGGAASTTAGLDGDAGTLSYVSVLPDSTTALNIIGASGNAAAGTTTSNVAGTAFLASQILLAQFAIVSSVVGQAGGARGISSGAAGSITPTGIPLTSGAGGSGVSGVGTLGSSGSITGFLFSPLLAGGISDKTLGGTEGQHGFSTRKNFSNINQLLPMFFTGGSGGGAGDTSPGANGGNGAFGSGGGGGGGGQGSAGSGGNGGNGLVIITCS
jgi:hypothetical protein